LITALYLAHLNPVTNAHVEIINELKSQAKYVKVMPVIFKMNEHEINSKSFPFTFEIRSKMLRSVFEDSIEIQMIIHFSPLLGDTSLLYCRQNHGNYENRY